MTVVKSIRAGGGEDQTAQRRGEESAWASYSSSHHTFCLESTSHLAGAKKQNPIFNEPIKCLEQQGLGGT